MGSVQGYKAPEGKRYGYVYNFKVGNSEFTGQPVQQKVFRDLGQYLPKFDCPIHIRLLNMV